MKRLAALLLISAGMAQARENLPVYGAWTGKIGNSPVNACLTDGDSHYFYLKHKQGITLKKSEGKADVWNEMVLDPKSHDWIASGKWTIAAVVGSQLTGTWTGNGKTQSIQLTRLSGLTEFGACGADYYAPIAAANKTSYRDGKVGKLAIRIAESPLGNSFELPERSEAARKINAFVAQWTEERTAKAYYCEMNGGGWEGSLTASAVLGNYLLVNDDTPDIYCGASHTDSFHSTLIFDQRTGEVVKSAGWLAKPDEIDDSLQELIMKQASACEGAGEEEPHIYPALPSAKGLGFALEYRRSFRNCDEAVEVSYAKLKPYLSKEGKALVQSVRLLSK